MRSFLNTCRNLQKTLQGGESVAEMLVRFRRNAGQFKTGTLVGTDEYGNKYYEDNSDENVNNVSGRDRWVEFPANIKERSGSAVPPEWYAFRTHSLLTIRHSWLHYTSDIPSPELRQRFEKSSFRIPHSPVVTGTDQRYTPDNFYLHKNFNPYQATGTPEPPTKEENKDLQKSINEANAARFGVRVEDL